MKTLIFLVVVAMGMSFSTSQSSSSSEEHEIIEYVADAFNVTEQDVTLTSPDLVLVDLGTSSTQGTASFTPSGENTEVTIVFPERTLNFIVEDEIHGL